MSQQILKLPMSLYTWSFSSRSCFFFSSKSLYTPQLSVKWFNVPRLCPIRRFASIKSGSTRPLKKKKRLDEICLERFEQYSRTFIQSWILQGKVFVDGKVVYKAGTPISDKAVVEIKAEVPKYVCRAGHKLEAAIELLDIDVTGKVALDSGLSTGGFTDCLLQYGASFVYGVDVGYGQVAEKIRQDERVCIIERTNLRYLSELPHKVDLVTLDLSFISILLVLPAVVNVMKEEATLVTLIKPQFEAHRSQDVSPYSTEAVIDIPELCVILYIIKDTDSTPTRSYYAFLNHLLAKDSGGVDVGRGGIVKDASVHKEVIDKIINGVESYGFRCKGWIESPLKGAEGNTEFLACFTRQGIEDPEHSTTEKPMVDSDDN